MENSQERGRILQWDNGWAVFGERISIFWPTLLLKIFSQRFFSKTALPSVVSGQKMIQGLATGGHGSIKAPRASGECLIDPFHRPDNGAGCGEGFADVSKPFRPSGSRGSICWVIPSFLSLIFLPRSCDCRGSPYLHFSSLGLGFVKSKILRALQKD